MVALNRTRAAMVQVAASVVRRNAVTDVKSKVAATPLKAVKPSAVKPKPLDPPKRATPVAAKTGKKPATEEVVGNKGVIVKLPKSLAECADDLYATRNKRLELAKEVEALQARETALKTKIIDNLPAQSATGISGRLANVKITLKESVSVKDWDKFYDFLVDEFVKARKKKNGQEYGVFSLLQKRVGDTAVKELWNAKKVVPGAEKFTAKDVSITKV